MGNLEQAKKQLLGPGRTKIRTVGLFRATLRWNGRVCQEEVYVIDKLHDALLGRPAIKSLDILPSLLEVTASTGKLSDPANILCHYPDLTAGLGLLKTEYRITLLPDAKPSAITYPRRVPLPMLPCVKRELERMENLGVIRKVDEATEWCAPIVAKKKGGELRICVDFGGLNKYILRERVVMPTVDECLARLAGATWLSWSRTEDTVLDPFYDSASPADPRDAVLARPQPRDTDQLQFTQPISPRLRTAATYRATAALSGHRANSTHFDNGAVPIVESRGTLIPRSLGPRRETPRPVRDETPESTADVTTAGRSEFDPAPESLAADRPPGQGGSRPTPLLNEAYAEDPNTAARVPWATLVVLYLQAQAHWNFLHKHYPERCASVDTIVLEHQWERVVFAAFHHVDVSHLSCGMFFLFFKGIVLEAALGPAHFLALLAVVILLVGLVNIFLVLVLCELYSESSICNMCMYTLAGVVVALDMIIRKHLGDTRLCYGDREFRTRPYVCFLIELLVLASCSEKNSVPISCGYMVGSLLCKTMLGSLIVSIPNPPRYIYLRVVPNAPVTYAFFAAVVFAFLCGPYPDTSTMAGATLTFRYPVWKPPLLWALYLGDDYQVAYVGLSLLAVGKDLERELGHCRFFCLTSGLLFAGHVLPEGLPWILWKYVVAFGNGVKSSVPRFSVSFSSSSVLVGTLLALKTIRHEMRRDSHGYQVALLTVPVPFWAGVLLELAYLHFLISDASTAVHVAGVLVGLITVHCREGSFYGRILKGPRRRCSCCSGIFDEERDETPATPAPSQPADIWCQVCAARTASPTAYRLPETTAYRYPEVLAEDTSLEDRP
ncbi:hypothetical protein MTO96_034811 [Rhipicephalus appendiculatus]